LHTVNKRQKEESESHLFRNTSVNDAYEYNAEKHNRQNGQDVEIIAIFFANWSD
jgi:hypothetical protein